MQICKKRNFFMKNMYATIFTFFHNLIYLKFIQNTSFSLTKFSLSKVKILLILLLIHLKTFLLTCCIFT